MGIPRGPVVVVAPAAGRSDGMVVRERTGQSVWGQGRWRGTAAGVPLAKVWAQIARLDARRIPPALDLRVADHRRARFRD